MRWLEPRGVRRSAAIVAIASLVAYLTLPIAHALSVGASAAADSRAGVAIEETDPTHSPLGCPICDKIGHARHGLALPVASVAPGAAADARAEALPDDCAHDGPERGAAPARAPPASLLFS